FLQGDFTDQPEWTDDGRLVLFLVRVVGFHVRANDGDNPEGCACDAWHLSIYRRARYRLEQRDGDGGDRLGAADPTSSVWPGLYHGGPFRRRNQGVARYTTAF